MKKLSEAVKAAEDSSAAEGLFKVETRRGTKVDTYFLNVSMTAPIEISLDSTVEPSQADIEDLAKDISPTANNLISDFKEQYRKNGNA